MALSIQQNRGAPYWPLGYINVAANGTPVNIMSRVDSGNVNAPGSGSNSSTAEYSPACRGLGIQGYHVVSANNGLAINTGNVYLLCRAAGGAANRADSGSILKVIPPGGDFFFPPTPTGMAFSPYDFFLDSDVNGEGALVTLFNMTNS